ARAADVPNLRGRPLGVVSYLSSRSYGVYLYHWPLLVAVRQLLPVRAAVAPAVLLLSFLAAEASYRLIERPLRYFSFSRNKRPANAGQKRMASFRLAASTLAMILLTASAYSIASAPQKTSIQLDLEAEAGLAASIMAKAQDGAAQPPESEKMSADKSNADKPGADSPDADMSAANDGIASGPAISSVPDAGGQDRLLPQRTEDSGALAETPPASPKSVLVVGDSVTLGASSAILETIPGSVVDAAESRDIRAGLTLLADYAEKGTLGDVIVVSLADNNLNRKTDERLLEVIRTYAADRKVVLVTGYGNADMQPVADFIRTLPEAYPNVAVADWAEAVALHTDWLYSDNTHIKSRDGKQLYADLIAEAIGRLEKTETG
ncbi:MAG: acyltransferase, partial [Firmicutes bacterium]|nr:acyltransferase [Bacillota bacterium]